MDSPIKFALLEDIDGMNLKVFKIAAFTGENCRELDLCPTFERVMYDEPSRPRVIEVLFSPDYITMSIK